jgi:hypothetical protein
MNVTSSTFWGSKTVARRAEAGGLDERQQDVVAGLAREGEEVRFAGLIDRAFVEIPALQRRPLRVRCDRDPRDGESDADAQEEEAQAKCPAPTMAVPRSIDVPHALRTEVVSTSRKREPVSGEHPPRVRATDEWRRAMEILLYVRRTVTLRESEERARFAAAPA